MGTIHNLQLRSIKLARRNIIKETQNTNMNHSNTHIKEHAITVVEITRVEYQTVQLGIINATTVENTTILRQFAIPLVRSK